MLQPCASLDVRVNVLEACAECVLDKRSVAQIGTHAP